MAEVLGSLPWDRRITTIIENSTTLLCFSVEVIISLKLTHLFRYKLTHPLTGGSIG